MASLDSANGPSDTNRPLLLETIAPLRASAWPPLTLPCAARRSNQALFWLTTFWISSSESSLYHSLLLNSSRYPFLFGVLISFCALVVCFAFHDTTNEPSRAGQLFRFGIHFPNGKRVVLRVIANGEVPH